jgi:nicotinamide-nucleotide adenylyltransferase
MASTYETGVIHGRFQVLHRDHLRYILAGKKLCEHLVVGITNPDPGLTREESADPSRSSLVSNPLTYYERYVIINAAMAESGLTSREFSVVPLPINLPDLYQYYVPLDAVFFLTIYDDWGRQKLRYFQQMGLKTHVLWEIPPEQKGISGSSVRNRMSRGEPWEDAVPDSVAGFMKKWNIPDRLRKLT